ncbi:MAG: bifunctional oligoribonuclease/PAP phosphatase NrnA [Thermoleophilia bacterium]
MTRISLEEIAERFPQERRILVASHENPDGDALGCVAAVALMAERLGIEVDAFIPGEGSFPPEYSFLPGLDRVSRGGLPEVGPETTVYVLDCATAGRLDEAGLTCAGVCLNLDHHQDNTRFGTHNHIDPTAASTTELLYRIFRLAGLPVDADVATALYVGLVTDTGRFQYGNTTPAAHRIAAELQEAGVDVNAVYRQIYESVPLAKVLLMGRAYSRLMLRLGGRLAVSWLEAKDFEEVGADESFTEGIIDGLRSIEGVRVAALVREQRRNGKVSYKGSLRSTDGSVDVASIAHIFGGGGHVQAAGFSSEEELDRILARIEKEAGARL